MRFLTLPALALAFALPATAYAAGTGSDSTTPPSTTKTTQSCEGVQVWDEKTKTCVDPKDSSLDADTLYDAVRELAYAGRISDAQGVLAAMPNQQDDRVLTYWGFTHRKLGDTVQAQAFYDRALTQNPDNILARSYMGQGMVDAGDIDGAVTQWREITARGGKGTWAEASLRQAIATGTTYNY
ncbi:MAG: hypothetical protein CML02_19550 [Pseudooceanicola sp.]|jgi:tetratricopeptide (TPR) repeat protein|nr:hypothetical protein [Pseudooceanicola sp.]|tara:strand:- start:544 stop:1092 length:549 start_codon:yes stop_codon:yes gene_type:complete